MITVQGLTKRFGRLVAVDGVSFEAPRGTVTGFLGPNGAGKTTTIRMLCGSLRPSSGRIVVDGVDALAGGRAGRDARRRIGYLPESTPLYPELRVVEYLRLRATIAGVARRARAAAVDRSIEDCWLRDVRRRPIGQLSKGYRQRVGLAAALVADPPVLVLDEPTVGLDPHQLREVRGLVRRLAEAHTILLSSHVLPEVEAVCDRVVLISRGKVRLAGTMDELRRRAARSRSYVVETRDPAAHARLASIAGVVEVVQRDQELGWKRLEITAGAAERDLRADIAGALAAAGSSLRELHRERASLEELFVEVAGDAAADRPASPGDEPPLVTTGPVAEPSEEPVA